MTAKPRTSDGKPMPSPFRKAQGRLLAAAIKKKGVTQQEVEKATGIKQSHVSAAKRGEKGFSQENLVKLASFLETSIDELTPKGVPMGPDDTLYADDSGVVAGSVAINKPHAWPPPEGAIWPEGLREFLERHGEGFKINRHERWRLFHFRTRREDWEKPQDDDFWTDVLDFFRKREKKERDAI